MEIRVSTSLTVFSAPFLSSRCFFLGSCFCSRFCFCSCSCSCSCSLCLLFLCLFSSPSTWLLLMSSSDASSAALPGLQMMKASALPSSPMEISWTLRYGGVSGLLLLPLFSACLRELSDFVFSACLRELSEFVFSACLRALSDLLMSETETKREWWW